jgi:tRNA A37 threonylcarbamoyladenosine modification protein TsaB
LFAASWHLESKSSEPRLVAQKRSHLVNCDEFASQVLKHGYSELPLPEIENNREELVFAGPGLSRLKDLERHFQSTAGKNSVWLPEAKPDAREVGIIALQKYEDGAITDPFRLMPVYLRPSAAEEKVRASPAS